MKSSVTSAHAPDTVHAERLTISSIWRRSNFGQISVVLALLLIGLFFQITTQGLFLGPRNLSNLVLQIATIGTLGLGAVLVLLIGEIDLTLGVVSYTCAAVSVVLSVQHGWTVFPAILAGLVVGALIGLINGIFVAVLRVPSFIVTLAGLLAYQGVVIHILYPQTSLTINDPNLANIATNYLPLTLGLGLPLVVTALYAIGTTVTRFRRGRKGLTIPPVWLTSTRIGGVAK